MIKFASLYRLGLGSLVHFSSHALPFFSPPSTHTLSLIPHAHSFVLGTAVIKNIKQGAGHRRVLLRSERPIAIGNKTLTITTFLFSRPLLAPPHACTANFCVFFSYRPTKRPGRTSLPLECYRNATNRTCSDFAARSSIRA